MPDGGSRNEPCFLFVVLAHRISPGMLIMICRATGRQRRTRQRVSVGTTKRPAGRQFHACIGISVTVCVCVCEREREREREDLVFDPFGDD